jgi:1-acyl-sn-glycerol-3-phosphate acyltransferase
MKIYRNNSENKRKRSEPKFKKIMHYLVTWGITSIFLFAYYLVASVFMRKSNYKKINAKLIKFTYHVTYYVNVFLLRKNIYKSFKYSDMPKHGHFVIFNHVNEFDLAYDLHFMRGIMMFDLNSAKKSGIIRHVMSRMGLGLLPGKEIKKTLDDVKDYLEVTNVAFYPEGHRSFSDEPASFKRGILKLAYEDKKKVIVFYKGGMANLGDNIYYYKSEPIDSNNFSSLEDFCVHLENIMKGFHQEYTKAV